MPTTTALPTCHACQGTGTDTVFHTPCTECERVGLTRIPTAEELAAPVTPDQPQGRGDVTGARRGTHLGATDKQISFLARLTDEREPHLGTGVFDEFEREFVMAARHTLDMIAAGRVISKTTMSDIIDETMQVKVPRAQRTETRPAPAASTGLDVRALRSGNYGVPGSDTRLKVKIDNVTTGKWAGWVFVKDAAEYGAGRKYGSARPGENYRGDITDELAAIIADPAAAAAKYGELTGRCCMCNRTLEDEVSVARGIGPDCFRRWGS